MEMNVTVPLILFEMDSQVASQLKDTEPIHT